MTGAGNSNGGVFELDLDEVMDPGSGELLQPEDAGDIVSSDVGTAQVKTFVLNEIRDLQSGKRDAQSVAEAIASDFEQRLNERVQEVRREVDQRIRRLESIKDLVLQELEMRNLAAVIVNAQLRVIALNDCGRRLLGDVDRLDPESELAEFARSTDERRNVSVRGTSCRADMIISDHPDAEGGAVLICIEPE